MSTPLPTELQPAVGRSAVDVLVVDDDDSVRSSLVDILTTIGYSTLSAADGVEALEVLGHTMIGVMLLDICMPRLDGLALLDLLDDLPPVILISATPPPMFKRADHKVIAQFDKPVKLAHLLDVIDSCIGSPALPNDPRRTS